MLRALPGPLSLFCFHCHCQGMGIWISLVLDFGNGEIRVSLTFSRFRACSGPPWVPLARLATIAELWRVARGKVTNLDRMHRVNHRADLRRHVYTSSKLCSRGEQPLLMKESHIASSITRSTLYLHVFFLLMAVWLLLRKHAGLTNHTRHVYDVYGRWRGVGAMLKVQRDW
ncbi:hypothetical protein BST61_g3206 [Cercospora zeina]